MGVSESSTRPKLIFGWERMDLLDALMQIFAVTGALNDDLSHGTQYHPYKKDNVKNTQHHNNKNHPRSNPTTQPTDDDFCRFTCSIADFWWISATEFCTTTISSKSAWWWYVVEERPDGSFRGIHVLDKYSYNSKTPEFSWAWFWEDPLTRITTISRWPRREPEGQRKTPTPHFSQFGTIKIFSRGKNLTCFPNTWYLKVIVKNITYILETWYLKLGVSKHILKVLCNLPKVESSRSKLTWLAGNSPLPIGNTSTQMVDCPLLLLMVQKSCTT